MDYLCDKCKCANEFTPLTRKEGPLEIHYLECVFCGGETIAAVTDSELRKNIVRYTSMAHTIQRGGATERLIRRVERLKKANIQRSRELRDEYVRRKGG